ncbi:MAG: PhaM family polyhydroxyalkanoate granule multifunctional regulatory protein [Caldimonas sp.]|uniref:PhaM family polyhydroxyalkanoate granule multifunctional regulatory protein n=1 Tax=Caldimonas sp. TaxID=2838790 RepID=UPI00391C8C51
MSDPLQGIGKLVPGFDFLQGLVKNAGSALPNFGQWVAPTLNPEELEKRIEELRTVQFWLEQNARMLGATIQALEVQRMTLSTLKTMNVPVETLRESLTLRPPEAAAKAADRPKTRRRPAAKAAALASGAAAAPAVDPVQWWGALTRQFTTLAASAMKDAASESARHLAGELVRQSFTAAEDTLRKSVATAGKAARQVKAGAAGAAGLAARAGQAAGQVAMQAATPKPRASAPRRPSAKARKG